jgi:hypothetical protein
MSDIYPGSACWHSPMCRNGVGPCYQAAADRLYSQHDEPRNEFPLMRDSVENSPYTANHIEAVRRYEADRIADDANHIHELLQATGLTAAEYMLLRNAALSLMPPRTRNSKPDDLV